MRAITLLYRQVTNNTPWENKERRPGAIEYHNDNTTSMPYHHTDYLVSDGHSPVQSARTMCIDHGPWDMVRVLVQRSRAKPLRTLLGDFIWRLAHRRPARKPRSGRG